MILVLCGSDNKGSNALPGRGGGAIGSSDFDSFFRNSICFMCFWFGLEILILVYKKVFFEILTLFDLLSFFEKSFFGS
jgi:hypothetical protein